MTGFSIKEYIRLRRLSVAAETLLSSKVKIIDLALRLRYDSPETFLRAFRKAYGQTPSAFRKSAQEAALFPPIDPRSPATASCASGGCPQPRFAYYREQTLWGRSLRTSLTGGKNLVDIPRFWDRLGDSGLLSLDSSECFYGVYDEWAGEDDFTLFAGREKKVGRFPVRFTVPAARYAVFTLEPFDPVLATPLWNSIYGNWFPDAGIERTDRLVDFERYSGDFGRMEIFIPVKE